VRAGINAQPENRSSAWLHIIGVALILAALFPYISATDDLVRSESLATQQDRGHAPAGKQAPNNSLTRLYETLDSPLACRTCTLTLIFFALWTVSTPVTKRDQRIAPDFTGRSPPAPLSA
jgi:hypothetical protein